jgi:hypothetical protein
MDLLPVSRAFLFNPYCDKQKYTQLSLVLCDIMRRFMKRSFGGPSCIVARDR